MIAACINSADSWLYLYENLVPNGRALKMVQKQNYKPIALVDRLICIIRWFALRGLQIFAGLLILVKMFVSAVKTVFSHGILCVCLHNFEFTWSCLCTLHQSSSVDY